MTNVSEITVLMSMPISPATCWFCDVARIAMPSFVRYTSASRPAIIATEVTMITICTLVIVAPSALPVMWIRHRPSMICGNAMRIAAPDDHRQVLQDDRHADRGDQRREARRVAQRPVGDALERVADRHADGHRATSTPSDDDRERRQRRCARRRAR